MKRAAIEKCQERLRRGRVAIEEMQAARTANEFAESWESYLVAMKAIGEVLRKGAEGSESSEQLLNQRWQESSSDPLLGYIREARNVEEHGLEPTARFSPPTFSAGKHGEAIRLTGAPGGGIRISPIGGSSMTVEFSPKTAKLLAVTARGGRTWDVPESHLGQDISDQSPTSIAQLGLAYFAKLVEDARTLA